MKGVIFFLLLLCVSLLFAQDNSAGTPPPEPQINTQKGPANISLGDDNFATLNLAAGLSFIDKKGIQDILEANGNETDDTEIGGIEDDSQKWLAFLEYNDIGYVKEDGADKMKAAELLEDMKKGTEESNEKRKELKLPAIHVVGWDKEPVYNSTNHTLTWSVLGQEDGESGQFVNYTNVVFGRHGILTVTVAGDYADVALIHEKLSMIDRSIQFVSGKDYGSYQSGDKIADITMTGLVAGGVGAAALAAAKTGLLGKIGLVLLGLKKFLVLILIGAAAFIKKLWAKISGKKEEVAAEAPAKEIVSEETPVNE